MKRIFGAFAYGDGPRHGCWWDETCTILPRGPLSTDTQTDVAIVGAGVTGLSAALHLARAGVGATVVDANDVGWGASGRNGGFCCLGGSKADDAGIESRFGRAGRLAYRRSELEAVRLVERLVDELSLDVDRHSAGETMLAHRASDADAMRVQAATLSENYGFDPVVIEKDSLAAGGFGRFFHGGLTIPAGFGLNPRKYVGGLADAAEAAGATIFGQSGVDRITPAPGHRWHLDINGVTLCADRVIVATNGYSSEDIPDWLRGRFMPGQSNVLVTRPLTTSELEAQGWTTDQMCYDTRNLLHYFRLLPDRRFLFGMRGGLLSGPAAEIRARRRVRADFESMFPAWRDVESAHAWSGMVCLARDLMPFVGAVPGQKGMFAGLCYHGNGVAMGTYSGALLAALAQGKPPDMPFPDAMKTPLRRFELGPLRRLMMPAAYAAYAFADR